MPSASDGQSLGPWSITDLAEYCVGTLTRQAEPRVRQSEPLVAEEISGVVRALYQPARRRKWFPGKSVAPFRACGLHSDHALATAERRRQCITRGRCGFKVTILKRSGSTWRRHHIRVS